MVALLAFYLGWTMGSRSGPEGAKEVRDAFTTLRKSPEFHEFVGSLRKQGAAMMHDVADRMDGESGLALAMPDVLARAYSIIRPGMGSSATG